MANRRKWGSKAAYVAHRQHLIEEEKRRMASQELEQKGQEVLSLVLDGLKAFFSGKAALMIGELPVRFKRDPEA
jgi:hypothetical protein